MTSLPLDESDERILSEREKGEAIIDIDCWMLISSLQSSEMKGREASESLESVLVQVNLNILQHRINSAILLS